MKRVAFVLAVLAATPAVAGAKFASYEGPNAVQQGAGGTKVEVDGVEFWTTGSPPHRYRVLGLLTDKRGAGLFSGSAVGSSSVAKRVKDMGGNAVIVADQQTATTGAVISNGMVGLVRRAQTQLVVVRYEDPPPGL